MKISHEVREYANQGMQQKAQEFHQQGSELYIPIAQHHSVKEAQ